MSLPQVYHVFLVLLISAGCFSSPVPHSRILRREVVATPSLTTERPSPGIKWVGAAVVSKEGALAKHELKKNKAIVNEKAYLRVKVATAEDIKAIHAKLSSSHPSSHSVNKETAFELALSPLPQARDHAKVWGIPLGTFKAPTKISYRLSVELVSGVKLTILGPEGGDYNEVVNYAKEHQVTPLRGQILAHGPVTLAATTVASASIAKASAYYRAAGEQVWLHEALSQLPEQGGAYRTWQGQIGGFADASLVEYYFEFVDDKGVAHRDKNRFDRNFWFLVGKRSFAEVIGASQAAPVASQNHYPTDLIAETLEKGEVISIDAFDTDIEHSHALKMVVLKDKTGHLQRALFKKGTRSTDNTRITNDAVMEYTAYAVNKILGFDFVPPSAYRKFSFAGATYEGYLSHYIRDLVPENQIDYEAYQLWVEHEENISDLDRDLFHTDVMIFDTLIFNRDRARTHASPNVVLGKHWRLQKRRPILIDHSEAFTITSLEFFDQTDNVFELPHLFNTGRAWKKPTYMIRRSTLSRLNDLKRSDFQNLVTTGALTTYKLDRLMQKRDKILAYFQQGVTDDGFLIEVKDVAGIYEH